MTGFACMVFVAQHWRSPFFEKVRPHGEGPPVALQVARLDTDNSITESKLVESHSETDQIAVQIAGYKRLARDYARGNREIKTVFLALGRGRPARSPVGNVLNAVRVSFQGRVLPDEELTDDIRYGDEGSKQYYDPKTHLPAAELVVDDIEWQSKGRAVVHGLFTRSEYYSLSVAYKLVKKGQEWRVTHAGVDYDWESRVMAGGNNGHSYRLELQQRPLDPRKHHIVHGKGDYAGTYLVDDKSAIGTDGGVPSRELTRFRLTVDGVPWPVSGRLWRDCFEPHLRPQSEEPLLFAWISADGSKVTVKMLGSDGAGGYAAVWHLRKDGKHRRTVESRA